MPLLHECISILKCQIERREGEEGEEEEEEEEGEEEEEEEEEEEKWEMFSGQNEGEMSVIESRGRKRVEVTLREGRKEGMADNFQSERHCAFLPGWKQTNRCEGKRRLRRR